MEKLQVYTHSLVAGDQRVLKYSLDADAGLSDYYLLYKIKYTLQRHEALRLSKLILLGLPVLTARSAV